MSISAAPIAGAHEGQEHLELFQGQLFIDQHAADPFWNVLARWVGESDDQKHCAFKLQA